jgi:LmbE family N-acetylglucosaminyl deacetylase
MKNILVIAPHADDEILGCGGTIRKKILEGNNVFILILTNAHVGDPTIFSEAGINKVRNEALKAHQLLGVKQTFFLDFPAPMLDQYPLYKISSAIAEIIKNNAIHIVYLPHRGDIHIDHKRVFDAALVSCRPVGSYTVKEVFSYETLSETEWGAPYSSDVFVPNFFETISEDCFRAKIDAIKCFQSQLRPYPSSRSIETIDALSKLRGTTISKERAEAFMLVRLIRD